MTTADRAEAERLGRMLVEERHAACVNILDGMTSIYLWQGAIESAHETVLIAKTDRTRADALIAALRAAHSYTIPCALVIDVAGGNPDYLAWLANTGVRHIEKA
jgi:periplasmic divalent cation tolerance protein